MDLKILSLFSSIGIGEIYIKDQVLIANEVDELRSKCHSYLHPKTQMITGSIRDENIFDTIIKSSKQAGINFILATPPCQGMSVAGKMKKDDSRNDLIKYVVKAIKELDPDYVLIENVPTLFRTSLYLEDGSSVLIKDYLLENIDKKYTISFNILNTADYGIPQTRKRAIVLISKFGEWKLPPKEDEISVREAIGYLPSLESGEMSDIKYHYAKKHNDRHIHFMKHTPSGKTALDNLKNYPIKANGERIKGYSTTYKRIEWDKPAPTITMANGSISSQNNVHPGRLKEDGTYSDSRVLTLKELFILSGLPEDWSFPEFVSDNFIRKMIGEGVPPLLVMKLIEVLND